MISDARGRHVSPGIYTEEKDVTYSVKSLGVTSLGLVGETQKGPAFQNIEIEDWSTFVDYFGGTSTERFKANGRPRYELPYIAKSYLEKSKRLNVVRVLGLSGYDAGDPWVLYGGDNNKYPILVLRSKMTYDPIGKENYCERQPEAIQQVVTKIEKVEYKNNEYDTLCASQEGTHSEGKTPAYKFGIKVTTKGGNWLGTYVYNVSLKSTDRDYIYNVLGTDPAGGDAPIYIDSLYEGMMNDKLGNEFINPNKNKETWHYYHVTEAGQNDENATLYQFEEVQMDSQQEYVEYKGKVGGPNDKLTLKEMGVDSYNEYIKVSALVDVDGTKYYASFKEAFRCAQTPWVVSNVSANATENTASMKKLFKFYTISDGNSANYQVKISIQNIRPDEGTFDVVVRDFYDNDNAPLILEKFSKCNMVEGDSGFIGFKIGTYDGGYVAKSKYITVEVAESDNLASCVPAGYIGYPSLFPVLEDGTPAVVLNYNTEYKPGIKAKRQYFGLNSDVLDTDILNYKGRYAYSAGDADPKKLTNGFHLDAIMSKGYTPYVDGVAGFNFSTVSTKQVTANDSKIPRIIDGGYMDDTIYTDVNVRKFTVYPYGGFDGWDVNRGYRTNGNDYKASKYNVTEGGPFGYVSNTGYGDMLNLKSDAITTDYYAFLGGYKQYANPQDVDINVFATPGIDWYNNSLLTEEALDIIEDKEDGRGGDALYILDSPQYSENGDMYSPEQVADMLDGLEIDSSYACTYFPWVKYFDKTQKMYIDLPATKDVVRNIADTDNNAYPWFAPAGISRGSVDCIAAVKKTTLDDEDILYENRINPVKSFAQDGVKIWGNKTLYDNETSPLNRINVRRLMIRIKKLIIDAAQALIFEQYDSTLEKQFRSLVEPILADAKSNRGISDYKVITEVTAETMDQHILPSKIMVKPQPSLEWVSISFVVYPQSVEFDEN